MKNQILSIYENTRNVIIKNLFDFVSKSVGKSIILDKHSYNLRVDDTGFIIHDCYKMLSIKDNVLLVHYSSGKGVNPTKHENYIDDIVLFSLDEIYCVVKNIKHNSIMQTF